MKIAVLHERQGNEHRVAITPDMVRKYLQSGVEQIAIETGAGEGAAMDDHAYADAGASIAGNAAEALQGAQIVLCVQAPHPTDIERMEQGALLVGMLDPYQADDLLPHYSSRNITAFSLELLPRISRAQSMDVLSSQSNIAGYRAVIEAANAMRKVVPMWSTAAGPVAPAKALVLGAGVAGLQAIATARRLGAVVSAFDVRPVVKEQVESLGAKFVEVPAEEGAETKGGYAKEMSEDYKKRQQQLIFDTIIKQDMVITTALIPGRQAPVLITEEMVKAMKKGAVIVDLAVASGGNCPLSEYEQVVEKHGVTLIGYANLPSHVASDASALYARNLYNFVSTLLVSKEGLAPKFEDELVAGTMLTKDGMLVHPQFKG